VSKAFMVEISAYGPALDQDLAEYYARVNLNTATADELATLPRVGPVLAGRIVEMRARRGRFTSISELRDVQGIDRILLGQLRNLVRL
jgi:competence protein ComEA